MNVFPPPSGQPKKEEAPRFTKVGSFFLQLSSATFLETIDCSRFFIPFFDVLWEGVFVTPDGSSSTSRGVLKSMGARYLPLALDSSLLFSFLPFLLPS